MRKFRAAKRAIPRFLDADTALCESAERLWVIFIPDHTYSQRISMALSKKAALWTAGMLIAPLTIAGVAFGTTLNDKDDRATVLRVIDGDTLDVELDGEPTRIRLLNIDTPETKHPHEAVQCLGPEATEFLQELLPAGTRIDLEYDVERKDRYDRTLAGVFYNDTLVNAQIAARGLGVAVTYEPNHKFYDEVKAAERQARNKASGLFDPTTQCTPPQMIENLQDQVEQLSDAQPQDVEEAEAELEALALVARQADHLATLLMELENHHLNNGQFAFLSHLYGSRLEAFHTQLDMAVATLDERETQLEQIREDIQAEEQRRRAEEKRKQQEQERKEKEERERQEAEAAERQRQQNAQQEHRRQAEADTARQQSRTPQNSDSSSGSAPAPSRNSNPSRNDAPSGYGTDADYPGYTGPRCYAPGGRSWKPC
ncbi:hypothetical protein GCM10022249_23110 [Enteractinococcus coprophilus]